MNKGLLFLFLIFWGTLLHAQNQNIVIDGVTFSADGKTLISYPRDKVDKEYVVPEGTEIMKAWAFSGNDYLHKIILPLSLCALEDYAFAYCKVSSLFFNSILKNLGRHVFDESEIQEFVLSEAISDYISIDGVLFSKDRKLLLLYPPYKNYRKEYVIPPGVQVISRCAFEKAGIQHIILPSSLQEIGDYAFYDSDLESVTWGNYPKLIGEDIFWDANSMIFFISEDNKDCVLIDGILFSKDGKCLLRYPLGFNPDLPIPEGTEIIGEHAFEGVVAYNVTLPSSVKRIENHAFRVRRNIPVESSVMRIKGSVSAKNEEDYSRCVKRLYCMPLIPPVLVGNPFGDVSGIALFVPNESFENYCNTPDWNEFMTINGHNLSSINNLSTKGTKVWFEDFILNVTSEQRMTKVYVYNQIGTLLIGQDVGANSWFWNMEVLYPQGLLLMRVVYDDFTEDIFKLIK